MREIKVNELKEGMTTAVDVFSPKGQKTSDCIGI